MPPAAKPALKHEPNAKTESGTENTIRSVPSALPAEVPRRLPNALAGAGPQKRPVAAQPLSQSSRQNGFNFQPRIPVLQGEAIYRGWLLADGIISGQLGVSGSTLTIKQRPRNGAAESAPELNGEITFKNMLRINGHIAGRVFSQKGTLIIDASARVDASIDVAVAVISGTVNGDVIGHERVEVGPGAIINGNISTRSLSLKPGAVFDGDCRMLKEENGDQ
ncbi:MAG TPA: polymer-forming cytoskeletal protein [Pyrinomonadaceae bacterium]|nr:polymer-forming cytoskeletal protein [Pyrinomonadaceae bacterium]